MGFNERRLYRFFNGHTLGRVSFSVKNAINLGGRDFLTLLAKGRQTGEQARRVLLARTTSVFHIPASQRSPLTFLTSRSERR
jgi:hypothetical protein